MSVRLLLGVALAASILALVACTASASAPYHGSSSSSEETDVNSKPVKCRNDKRCPKNEEFTYCTKFVKRAQYCSEKEERCRAKSNRGCCKKGCVCKENYLRVDNGTCVPAKQCPIKCGTNEVLDTCPSNCKSDYCPTEDTEAESCEQPDVCPPPKCKCAFNYRRVCNGSCIPTRDCPPFECSTNEEYNPCPPICPTDDCSQASPTGECPPQFGRIGIILPCNPKCRCIKDYWRLDGICVPYGQCPGVCPDNERYSECIQGECRALYCTQKDESVPCVRIDPKFCIKGCVCTEGYFRNQDDICVLEDQCEPTSCPTNEELVPCTQGVCRAKYCSERGQDVPCPDIPPEECDSACICKGHFLRAENGSCIPEDQCESEVCPDNERYSECIQGECRALKCTEKDQSVPCVRIDPQFCRKGCVCVEGYLRNQYGICVLEDECKPPVCAPNEEWSTCAQAICRSQNCTQRGKPIACPLIMEGYCEEACVCKEGYLRNSSGDCIPENECPCDENEVLVECPMTTCNTDYCPQSADEEGVCVQADPCIPTCKCKFNYKRAENGTCIPTRECPPFDCSAKPFEEFVACPPICPSDECGKPRLEGRCPFRIGIILECKPKCQCIDGYGRVNGTCVPFEECPDLCSDNEEYSSCVQRTCRPQYCTERDVTMDTCPSCNTSSCQRGCVCKKDYYRSDEGVCVHYDECEGPMCPYAHEVYTPNFKECPPNICKSLVAKFTCDQNQTEGPGCLCESGYLRQTLTSPCIPICDCLEMANSLDCL